MSFEKEIKETYKKQAQSKKKPFSVLPYKITRANKG
jgi:hypothetical protein